MRNIRNHPLYAFKAILLFAMLISAFPVALLHAADQLSFISFNPARIVSGTSSTGTIFLNGSAPAGGLPVNISVIGTGVTAPSVITINAGSVAGFLPVTTTASTPAQTAVILAVQGGVTRVAPLDISSSFIIHNITASPGSIIPGTSTRCVVTLSGPTSAGMVATISTSSPYLTAPTALTFVAGVSFFQFDAAASAATPNSETVSITVSIGGSTRTVQVKIDTGARFYLRCHATEIPGVSNGTTVTPTTAPAGLTGNLNIKGTGSMSFEPISGSNGISFHDWAFNADNSACINFTGQKLGQIFGEKGEFRFLVRSSKSFAQRKASPSPNMRLIFTAYDDNNMKFAFSVYTSTNALMFGYTTMGATGSYGVPAGQEDAVFGAGVTMSVRVAWTATSHDLYINGSLVSSSSGIHPSGVDWSANSCFTLGAIGSSPAAAGSYACDDAIAEFKVIGSGEIAPNQPPTANAGPDQTIIFPANAVLLGSGTDDNLPNPPGTLGFTWSAVSGPGTVSFPSFATSRAALASFSQPGTYVIRLTVNDFAATTTDDTTVTVLPSSGGGNSGAVPVITASSPSGKVPAGASSVIVSVRTDIPSDCRYSLSANSPFASMTESFSTPDGLAHSKAFSGLLPGTRYTLYVKARNAADLSKTSATDHVISFETESVEAPPEFHSTLAYPNPAKGGADPVLRVKMGRVESLEITIFNAAGNEVYRAAVPGEPTGIDSGEYYYDHKWAGAKAPGVYYAVITGRSGGLAIPAKIKFAVSK